MYYVLRQQYIILKYGLIVNKLSAYNYVDNTIINGKQDMIRCQGLKLLVTTKPGKEDTVELQIGDALFRIDSNVKIVKVKYPGVLLVYTNVELWKAFWSLMTLIPHGATRIVPVEYCLEKISEAPSVIEKLVNEKKVREVNLEIVVRGKHYNENSLRGIVKSVLRKLNVSIKYKASHSLKIETIDNIIVLALIPKGFDKISHRISSILRSMGVQGV